MPIPFPDTPDHERPDPIPVSLAHLPVVAGLAVPWITISVTGQPVFGAIDAVRQRRCLIEYRCQICGLALERPIVLLVRQRDLDRRLTAEPGLHPWCAAYTIRACPMIAGRMNRYRRTERDLSTRTAPDTTICREHPAQTAARQAAPAEPWFTLWLNDYRPVWDSATGSLAASFDAKHLLRVRRVSGEATS